MPPFEPAEPGPNPTIIRPEEMEDDEDEDEVPLDAAEFGAGGTENPNDADDLKRN